MKTPLSLAIATALLPLTLWAEFAVQSYQKLKNDTLIRQNYEQSCGAASLATLLNLSNFKQFNEIDILTVMSENELRTDMVSFTDLMNALNKLDYESSAYQITRQSLDKLIDIPLLVKIEDDPRFPHFVVIINKGGGFLQVFDPSFGKYISSKRQFLSVWDKDNKGGFALIVLPKGEWRKENLNLPDKLHFEFTPFKFF